MQNLAKMHNLKKKRLFALKNDNDQKNEEQKYNGLKEKIFTNKMVHQF